MEKGYLKQKLRNYKSVRGSATLNPPSAVDVLQSSASMSVVDNIGEGPIYGLVDTEGKKVNNVNILESLFLDGTAVKPRETDANIQFTGIPVDNIELVGRLENKYIESAFDNIEERLYDGFNLSDENKSFFNQRQSQLKSDLEQLKEFVSQHSNLGRYGFIQFHLSGIYDTGDLIYSRGNFSSNIGSYLSTQFDLDVYLGDQPQKRTIKTLDDDNINIPEPFVYGYQIFNDNIDYENSPGALDIGQEGKVGNKYLTSGFAGGGIVFFDLGISSGSDNVSTETRDIIELVELDEPEFALKSGLSGVFFQSDISQDADFLSRNYFASAKNVGNPLALDSAWGVGDGPLILSKFDFTDFETDTSYSDTFADFEGFFLSQDAGTYNFRLIANDNGAVWIGDKASRDKFHWDYNDSSQTNSRDIHSTNNGNVNFNKDLAANTLYKFRLLNSNGTDSSPDLQLWFTPPGGSETNNFSGWFFHRDIPEHKENVITITGEDQVTYSSRYNDSYDWNNSRLDDSNGWRPTNTNRDGFSDDGDELWMQFDLLEDYKVLGVVTQGRPSNDEYTTKYSVQLAPDGNENFLQNFGVYSGNSDGDAKVSNRFNKNFAHSARYVRINPLEWSGDWPAIRLGVIVEDDGRSLMYNEDLDQSGFAASGYNTGNRDVTGLSNSGDYIVSSTDGSLQTKLDNAIESGYDVFIHDGTNLSLSQATPNQIEPAIGETNGLQLNLGFQSDLNAKYNYSNIDFDFRNGLEFQPVLDGYEEGAQDFDIRKKLYGPLSYAGSATDGAGSGFLDNRVGGEFSNWMTNPPLEHDSYPYTHTIKRIGVKKAIPTIAIEGLSDTIDDGDDAGVQKAERLDLKYTYGFEGGVTGIAGDLLSGGNSIKEIALGTLESSETQQFEGIVTSNYLNTYSSISDLPLNKSIRYLKVDAADVPGLTDALLTEFDLTSGDLIFPGEEWKVPNRFLRVEKLSFETNSTLISRECSLSYVTEIIGEKFTYPFSTLGATTFDARNFATQPSREYLIRGREVMIPSNYAPLNPDGSDKRFVNNSSTYGLRDIQTFNGSTYIKVADKIDLGTENYEISFKVKFGSFNTTSAAAYLIDVDGDDFNTPGRIAIYHRDNGGGSSPEIGMVGKDDGGNTDFSNKDISISAYSVSDVFTVSLKAVGSKYTLTVKVGETLVGTETGTLTSRPSFSYDPSSGKSLLIGASTEKASGSFQKNGTKIADFKIKKNNQLLHHWDGTVINTIRLGDSFKDKFGGNHGEIVGTANAVEDADFEFGPNKEQIYIGEWDGSFKLGWTDNPAWILYDLMVNPIYGIGNNIDDREDINIFNLYSIARYCDAVDSEGLFDGVPDSTVGLEPRFSCNLRISEAKNAFETLGNLASVFRGFTYWDGLGLNFAIDKPKEITAIFNNGNVFDGVFNYGDTTSSARFTRVEVNYSDARDEYTQKVEYVEDEDRIRQYGIITNKLNGIGTTSKSQARRMGKYVLFSNKLETEIVQFKAGLEAIFLEPGDIIRIDDELKNFEINYGKVLGVSSATPNPYIDIQDTVDINSIQTGVSGGLYAYNDKKQDELKDLYEIANFETVYTFGEDSDVYSGVINNGIIDRQTQERVTKFNITGKESRDNSVRLFLDTGYANYDDITGVKAGSFFNVELDNDVNFTYKIVKKSQVESNIFEIDAMQYVSEKFDLTEDDDFDIEESSYNIGIPSNTINRPSVPTVVSNTFQENNLTYSITGEITAAADSNETSYRVVLYRTNQSGPYLQKEFQRESDDTTSFKMFGLVDGNYTVKVAALRNPESSTTFTSDFTISPLPNIYTHNLIESINLDDESNASYQRINGSGSGNGSTIDRDVIYQFGFADMKGRSYSIERFDSYTLDIYALSGSDYNLVKSDHGLDTFKFTEYKNTEMFGSFQTGFQLKFELKESGTLVDSAFYDAIII